jgi:ribosomal protein L30/L7E
MVININDEYGGVKATTTLEAIDPASGETLFMLKLSSTNHMVGVQDREHYNPILNAFDGWIAQNLANAQ